MKIFTFLFLVCTFGLTTGLGLGRPILASRISGITARASQVLRRPVGPVRRRAMQNRTLPIALASKEQPEEYVYPGNSTVVSRLRDSGTLQHYSTAQLNHIPIVSYDPLVYGQPVPKVKTESQTNASYDFVISTKTEYNKHHNSNQVQDIVAQLSSSLERTPPGQKVVLDPTTFQNTLNLVKQHNEDHHIEEQNNNEHEAQAQRLRNRIFSLQQEIDQLNHEIEALKSEGKGEEAAALQQDEQALEDEKLNLTIAEYQEEDKEIREEINELRAQEDTLIEQKGNDLELAHMVDKIVDLEVQGVNIDIQIKAAETDQIEVQIQELEQQKEGVEVVQNEAKIDDIEAKIAELSQNEAEIKADHQIQDEITAELKDLDQQIQAVSTETGHTNQFLALLKAKRKLKDEDYYVSSGTFSSAASTGAGYDYYQSDSPASPSSYDSSSSGSSASSSTDANYQFDLNTDDVKKLNEDIENNIGLDDSENNPYNPNLVAKTYTSSADNTVGGMDSIKDAAQALEEVDVFYQNVFSRLPIISDEEVSAFDPQDPDPILDRYEGLVNFANDYKSANSTGDNYVYSPTFVKVFNTVYSMDITSDGLQHDSQNSVFDYFGLRHEIDRIRNNANDPDNRYNETLEMILGEADLVASEVPELKAKVDFVQSRSLDIDGIIQSLDNYMANQYEFNDSAKAQATVNLLPELITINKDIQSGIGFLREGLADLNKRYDWFVVKLGELSCDARLECNQNNTAPQEYYKRKMLI